MKRYLEENYGRFTGRSQRKEFWLFVLIMLVIGAAIRAVDLTMGTSLAGYCDVFVFVPYVAVTARRLHDIGKSGWWQTVAFPPAFALGMLPEDVPESMVWLMMVVLAWWFATVAILLWWMVTDGDPEQNRFGSNPKLSEK